MNVLLVGHRGAGKSTIGSMLAFELRMELVDIDSVELAVRLDGFTEASSELIHGSAKNPQSKECVADRYEERHDVHGDSRDPRNGEQDEHGEDDGDASVAVDARKRSVALSDERAMLLERRFEGVGARLLTLVRAQSYPSES